MTKHGTKQRRYACEIIASFDDLPDEPEYDPITDVKYTTLTDKNLCRLIRNASAQDIDGECYRLRLEQWQEISPGDGVYDWQEIERLTLPPEYYNELD